MSLEVTHLPKDTVHAVVPTCEPFYAASDCLPTKIHTSSTHITSPIPTTHLESFVPNSPSHVSPHSDPSNSPGFSDCLSLR